jgi:hypothetical protein
MSPSHPRNPSADLRFHASQYVSQIPQTRKRKLHQSDSNNQVVKRVNQEEKRILLSSQKPQVAPLDAFSGLAVRPRNAPTEEIDCDTEFGGVSNFSHLNPTGVEFADDFDNNEVDPLRIQIALAIERKAAAIDQWMADNHYVPSLKGKEVKPTELAALEDIPLEFYFDGIGNEGTDRDEDEDEEDVDGIILSSPTRETAQKLPQPTYVCITLLSFDVYTNSVRRIKTTHQKRHKMNEITPFSIRFSMTPKSKI